MPTLDPRVDAYIDQAHSFARPLLAELRRRVHAACPDVVETIKWRMPSFEHHGLIGGMAAFQKHCSFGFWKQDLLQQDEDLGPIVAAVGRMKTVADLPPKAAFARVVKRAMELNERGETQPRRKAGKRPPLEMHPDFARALAADTKAQGVFAAFAPSCQREYVEWIGEAKKDETRARRIEQAIDWIASGKKRNWKYESC